MMIVRCLPVLASNAPASLVSRLCVAGAILLFMLTGAFAHPHVFVEARSRLVFDDAGQAVAVRHAFRFDDAFTAFAIQGFDKNNDGVYSREELSELAEVNIESMAEWGYFTFGDNTRIEFDFKVPTDYWLEVATVPLQDYWMMKPEDFEAMQEDVEMNGGSMPEDVDLLELHFTLPLTESSDADHPITLDVYDPTYYVDFRFGREPDAVGTANAPGNCRTTRREPPPLDNDTAYALAQIGANQRELPPELQSAAASQVNQMIVTCGDAAAAPGPEPQGGTEDVAAAAQQDAAGNDAASQSPAEIGFFDRFFGMIATKQKEFYQAIIASLREFKNDPNAGWKLMWLSLAYGIFHAAGPGHGKAIITSYVLADNETLRKGIALSFASAFAQALTAIVIGCGIAVVFKLTSIAIQNTALWFEVGSYLMITALGGWLLWRSAGRPLMARMLSRARGSELAFAGGGHGHHHHHQHDHGHHGHGHHHHDHDIGHDGICSTCGHAHAPTPDMIQGRLTLGRAFSIIMAVGLRPCSGALVVLGFALSLEMIAAGIASTLAMALGTGITVAVLASLAVSSKDVAVRLFGNGSRTSTLIYRSVEIGGATLVFLFGLTLLIATLGWGQVITP